MSNGATEQTSDASSHDSDQLAKAAEQRAITTAGGSTGPTTERGKQKSRQNAIKHGIFAVGVIRSRESQAEYLSTVEDMVETLQPVGSLEEILVEKLAMLVWRYRRLLQAEAAEVASQVKDSQEAYQLKKGKAAIHAESQDGLIPHALNYNNEECLEEAIAYLRNLRQRANEKGLDWQRDRIDLRDVYGPVEGWNPLMPSRMKETDPAGPLASRYRELADTGEDEGRASNVPRDAAESIVRMLSEEINKLEIQLKEWRQEGDQRNQLEETRKLVPCEDRLQRYEASLDRSFDRTLSQLERLQRMRLGQPVLPAVKLDISH